MLISRTVIVGVFMLAVVLCAMYFDFYEFWWPANRDTHTARYEQLQSSAATDSSDPRCKHHASHLIFSRYEPSAAELAWEDYLAKPNATTGPHCPPLFKEPFFVWVSSWIAISKALRTGTYATVAEAAAAVNISPKLVQETLSVMHFTDACSGASVPIVIEPLLGFMRDPRPVCPVLYNASGLPKLEMKGWQSKETIIRDPLLLEYWRGQLRRGKEEGLHSPPRTLIFDLGASTYSHGSIAPDGRPYMSSVAWLTGALDDAGIRTDALYAYESAPSSVRAFTRGMPPWLPPRTVFFNIPAAFEAGAANTSGRGPGAKSQPIRYAFPLLDLRQYAAPSDIVLFKLDIDSPWRERGCISALLANASLASLVDEFYFEHHYFSDAAEMGRSWGRGSEMDSILQSLRLFQSLRRAGMLAHVWP